MKTQLNYGYFALFRRFPMARILLFLCINILIGIGCTPKNAPADASEGTLEKVKRTKELNVGYFVLEPSIMEEPNSGKKSGIFIDLIESIGKSLDAKIVYHKIDLANFAAGLQAKQFDLCIGATFATPKRAAAVLFTRPLFYSGYTGVAKKGMAKNYTKWSQIDAIGLRVAVKQGSAIDDYIAADFKNAKIIRLSGADLTLPLAAVSSGQADVGLMNQQTVYTYLRAHPELEEVLPDQPAVPTNFSWAVRPDDLRWLNFINTCLEYQENTGELYRYEKKYGIPLLHARTQLAYPSSTVAIIGKTK